MMQKYTVKLLICLIGFILFLAGIAYPQAQQPEGASGVEKIKTALTSGSPPIPEALKQSTPDIPWSLSIGKILWALLFLFMAYFALKYLTRILEAFANRWINIRLHIKRSLPIIRIVGWTLVIYLVITGIFAPPIETLLAITASAGIALGFSAQDILKNIFGGIMILLDRPFQVGDRIQIKEHYGEVVQIGLRTVRIVTADDSIVSIPNSDVVNQPVSNSNSGDFNCQVVSEFYLPPGIDLKQVKKMALRAASVSRYVYLNKPITVILKNELSQGRSVLKMRLKAYVLDLQFEHLFASEMTEFLLTELSNKELLPADGDISA